MVWLVRMQENLRIVVVWTANIDLTICCVSVMISKKQYSLYKEVLRTIIIWNIHTNVIIFTWRTFNNIKREFLKPLSYAFSIATMPISDRMESFLVHNIFAFLFIVVLSERYGEREYFRIGFSCLWLFFFSPMFSGWAFMPKVRWTKSNKNE